MAFSDFKNNFLQHQQELEPVVKNALDQLLQKELKLDKEVREEPNLTESLQNTGFPSVKLQFVTGGITNHLIILDTGFVTQFYAWMIADEPSAEVTDEHLEGIKEALDQVFGQIKISVADDQANYTLSDVDLKIVNSAEELTDLSAGASAMHAMYSVFADDKQFNVSCYSWPVPATNNTTGQTAQRNEGGDDMETSEMEPVTVQPAEFGNLSGSGSDLGSSRNVDMLLDVDLEVTVELDRKSIMVSELLKLGKGSIIELEKSAGEPLDILINGRKFAEGEVVVIDDKFGIRLTQLLSPKERIKSLG